MAPSFWSGCARSAASTPIRRATSSNQSSAASGKEFERENPKSWLEFTQKHISENGHYGTLHVRAWAGPCILKCAPHDGRWPSATAHREGHTGVGGGGTSAAW